MYEKSAEQLQRLGVGHLPRSLGEGIAAFETDPLGRQVMGDAMADAWLVYKRDEWLSYLHHVSDWEKDRYLKFF